MALRTQRPARSKSLTAAAEKLADRLAASMSSTVGEGWQAEAWEMYDAVPELRTAARVTGQAMSQVRLTLATVGPDGIPEELKTDDNATEPHPASALLSAFCGGPGGQAAMLDAVGTHLTVPGESVLVGNLDPEAQKTDDFARFQAYSPQQIRVQNRQVAVRLDESTQNDRSVNEDDGMTAIRVWRPHPKFSWQADSAARSAMQPLREIVLYDQHIEATAISRLISAGLLKVPEGLTLPGLAADSAEDEDTDPFVRFLMHVMGIAIKDRNSAAARVPIMVRGEKEDLEGLGLMSFATPFDDKVADLRERAVGRLGTAVDMPGELLTGYGDLQHWTGALVTDDWVNNYLPALMTLVCGSLTEGWLYPALAKLEGNSTKADVIVWYDASGVRTRENPAPEAERAYERNVISGSTYRRVLGYTDSDAPKDDELSHQLALNMLSQAPASLAPLLLPYLGITFTPEQLVQVAAITAATNAPAGDAGAAPPTGRASSPPGGTPSSGGAMPGARLEQSAEVANGYRTLRPQIVKEV